MAHCLPDITDSPFVGKVDVYGAPLYYVKANDPVVQFALPLVVLTLCSSLVTRDNVNRAWGKPQFLRDRDFTYVSGSCLACYFPQLSGEGREILLLSPEVFCVHLESKKKTRESMAVKAHFGLVPAAVSSP